MKKYFNLTAAIFIAFFFLVMIPDHISAQANEPAKTAPASLPADVSKVILNSCAKCHIEPGNNIALSKVNFSKWDSYDAAKQAKKALDIEKEVNKGKMPPKGFKKDHPDLIPTDADKTAISTWAKSLQPSSK